MCDGIWLRQLCLYGWEIQLSKSSVSTTRPTFKKVRNCFQEITYWDLCGFYRRKEIGCEILEFDWQIYEFSWKNYEFD